MTKKPIKNIMPSFLPATGYHENMRYIDMDWEQALIQKYESGRKKHRRFAEDKEQFTGDPVEELYQELLDGYHYVLELEIQGVELPGFRTTLKNMAITLKNRRDLKR